MLQNLINYLRNIIESYAIIYYNPDYNNHILANPEHFYDDREYKIKDTIFKNGKVQPSEVERI
tara:strand:+ start:1006 stop:1194 length:189 start_codon:yes stop_codon:yes gene_type:complete